MTDRVTLSIEGGIARVLLANPGRRNAITMKMYAELERACQQIAGTSEVRVVVLRGAGGSFAAGTDIGEFAEFRGGEDGLAYERRIGRVLGALAGLTMPVVAVVEGPAAGAGLALAACSDLVVATPDATFGAPIARTLGNCLAPAVLARLQSRLGAARTMKMLLTATMLSAAEAHAAGFVADVVPAAELDQHVEDLLARLVSSAPLTLAALKEVDRRLAGPAVDADDVLLSCYGSADFAEGVRAFLAHRPPHWTGS